MRAPLACLLMVGCTLAARGTAEASPSARLVYARTPEAGTCPAEPALRSAVAARVGYDPFFPWAKQTVVVQVWKDHGRHAARVQLLDDDGVTRGTRELSSAHADCSELFDALALAISISLDAAAALESAAAPADPPAPAPQAAAPAAPPPPPDPPEAASPPSDRLPPPPRPQRASLFAGADALVATGTAPSVAFGGAAFVGVRYGFLSGALELKAHGSAASSVSGGGDVSSWLFAASLVPCGHYGAFSLCALGALGSTQAHGDVAVPRSASALFAGVGGRAAAELGLTQILYLRAHADLLYDLTPLTFAIDGGRVWGATPFGFSAGVGAGAHFP
jgi:hypothetical protein